jgi:hypothetical protein
LGISSFPKLALKRCNETVNDPELRDPHCVVSVAEHDVSHALCRPPGQESEPVVVTSPAVEEVRSPLPC